MRISKDHGHACSVEAIGSYERGYIIKECGKKFLL